MNLVSAPVILIPPLWLGMIIAISFIEAPLKFRAPKVTLDIGLGIGRKVFAALNCAEVILAIILGISWHFSVLSRINELFLQVLPWIIFTILLIQIILIRPFLMKRTKEVLELAATSPNIISVQDFPTSRAHYYYVLAELIKTLALILLCFSTTSHLVMAG